MNKPRAHIDISIRAGTNRERQLLDEIRRRGLCLQRVHSRGTAVRLTGPGIHVLVSALGSLTLDDLQPMTGKR